MLHQNIILKYKGYSLSKLIQIAQKNFNKFIRQRDKDELCISCKASPVQQAGHYYSAGHFSILRFNEDNTHGQCIRCNYYLSGNLTEYRRNLEKKIGKERLNKLDELAAANKRNRGFKWDRFALIEIIEQYKNKTHESDQL